MATPEARAAKERKQKIFVAVGGVVLLALLAFQLPKLLGGSESAAATPAGETTTVGGETTAGAPAPTAIPVALVDTDRPLALGPGQLRSFSVFTRKDPFIQQVVQPEPVPVNTTPSKPAKPKVKTPSKNFNAQKKAAAPVTVVSVNGVRQALEPGTAFPTADPVFVLVSEQPKANTVVVGVRGGKYANGSRTTKLEVGKPLELVNKTTGTRYRIVLVKVGGGTATAPKR